MTAAEIAPEPGERNERSSRELPGGRCPRDHARRRRLLREVLLPWLLSRLALLLTGWLARGLPRNPHYPVPAAVDRGWHFSPHRLLDIWGRWDTGFYLRLAESGYAAPGDFRRVKSTLAFFPLYPFLIRLLARLLPAGRPTPGALLLVATLLSNAALLPALLLLHRLVAAAAADEGDARRAVLYLLLFPASIFLSAGYSESLFLALGLGAFHLASRRSWLAAGLLGGLTALTRPGGVLLFLPLLWMYGTSIGWQLRRLRPSALGLLSIPFGLLLFLLGVRHLTGNLWAPLLAQAAWDRSPAPPWQTLLAPRHFDPLVTPLDGALGVSFALLGVLALWRLSSPALGLHALLLLLPPLCSGTLLSLTRFCAVTFPAFILLGQAGRRPLLHAGLVLLLLALQLPMMAAWSQLHWVG